uniref:Toxin_TOLIP domain-containing protein n=1 Tax=Steinernema glaseri TaxID=37863 RepID=A0A1I8ADC6_9BILA
MPCALLLLLLLLSSSCYLHSDALDCYSCFTDSRESQCYSNVSGTATDTCLLPTAFCQVWSLVAESDGLVYMFERGCTESCSDGCVSLADIENRFASCTSCCSEDFCNTDKVATTISRHQPHFWIAVSLVAYACL